MSAPGSRSSTITRSAIAPGSRPSAARAWITSAWISGVPIPRVVAHTFSTRVTSSPASNASHHARSSTSQPLRSVQSNAARNTVPWASSSGRGVAARSRRSSSNGSGTIASRPRSTPAAAKASTACALGTHTSSIALHRPTQSAGMRSVSNIVRPTRARPGAYGSNRRPNVCCTEASTSRQLALGHRDQAAALGRVDRLAGVPHVRLQAHRGALLLEPAQERAPARGVAGGVGHGAAPHDVHRATATGSHEQGPGACVERRRRRGDRVALLHQGAAAQAAGGGAGRVGRHGAHRGAQRRDRRLGQQQPPVERVVDEHRGGRLDHPLHRHRERGPRLHQLLVAAPGGRDHGDAAGGGLQHRHPGALAAGGQHEGVGRRVEPRHGVVRDGVQHQLDVGDVVGAGAEGREVRERLLLHACPPPPRRRRGR